MTGVQTCALPIFRYFERCVDKYALAPSIRFDTEIAGAVFDEREGIWRLRTTEGEEIEAHVLVSGTGQLNRPAMPDIDGLASFGGAMCHSARWDESHDLGGEKVAVIGSGASAVQIIPQLALQVSHLTCFQRSPSYVIPRKDRAYTALEKWVFRHLPFVLWLYRSAIYLSLEMRFVALLSDTWPNDVFRWVALRNLQKEVADPELASKLTPSDPPGCKRLLISDEYYQALVKPHVELVTTPIARVTRDAIVTKDGVSHPVSTIVLATGFETTTFLAPMEIVGRAGVRLADAWKDGAEAHYGVVVAGFPSLFLMYGPNTNLGHNSIIFMIECQVTYAIGCIEELVRRSARFVDVRPEAMARFNAELVRDLSHTTWASGCHSWYKTATGKITNNWSGFTIAYWWRTREPRFDEFEWADSR